MVRDDCYAYRRGEDGGDCQPQGEGGGRGDRTAASADGHIKKAGGGGGGGSGAPGAPVRQARAHAPGVLEVVDRVVVGVGLAPEDLVEVDPGRARGGRLERRVEVPERGAGCVGDALDAAVAERRRLGDAQRQAGGARGADELGQRRELGALQGCEVFLGGGRRVFGVEGGGGS